MTHAENLTFQRDAEEKFRYSRNPPKLIVMRVTYCGRPIGGKEGVREKRLQAVGPECGKCCLMMAVLAEQRLLGGSK